MEEASKVRLVRCPKCENVLPELPDFSVYRCGGCGAILRGTNKAAGSGDLLEKSDNDQSDGLNHSRRERVFQERSANLTTNSSSRTENREILVDSDRINKEEIMDSRSNETTKIANLSFLNELEESRLPNWYLRDRPVMDQRNLERNERFTAFPYPDEVPANYPHGSFYGYSEPIRNRDSFDGRTTVENLENDRAELLRKLDELTNQLSRSCDTTEKPNERFAGDMRMASDRVKHVREPSSLQGPVSDVKNHALDVEKYYHPRRNKHEFLGYEDPYWPQIPSRQTYQPPPQYLPPAHHDQFSKQYMEFADPVASYQHGTFFHQLECSCLQCYNKNRQIPTKAPPPVFSRRSQNDPTYPIYYDHVNPITNGPLYHNSRGFQPPQLHSREPQPHTRSLSDFESDNDGFGFGYRHQRRKAVVVRESQRICRPVASGAPFITCCNCFVLLKLPRKVMAMGKKQRRLQCGACSALISIEVENKGIHVSVSAQIKQDSDTVSDGFLNIGATNSCSDHFDHSGYNFQLTDTETDLLPRDRRSNSSEAETRHELHSSCSSKHEHSPTNSVIVQKDDVSLSLKERVDYSSDDNVVGKYGKGNKSKRTDQDKRQSSVEDATLATEVEVFSNEYYNSGVSQDFVETSKEEDRPRVNKGSESFFAGLIKRSFRDLSRSNQSMENHISNVFVNGKHIAEHVVNKAEKKAGPIQPGEYWYDFRAGFWGVMGQPCLGIIPPGIEEFNYPMPENCGDGNTGVFVNGRELHRRDLDLLCGRGLPRTVNKSYVIKISGRVFDEDTGEELDSLGKLAPTVAKAKHGFGMKIPRAMASSS